MRETADRQPSGAGGRRPAELRAWDRVLWQTEGDGDFTAEEASRPILVALEWLHRHGLLSQRGTDTLQSAVETLDTLALERDMVLPEAAAFLDAVYLRWHSSHGTNLIIDGAVDDTPATDELERLWTEHTRKAG